MSKSLLFIFCCYLLISCKSPEPRRPIQSSSGSFISNSAERNKALLQEEEAIILQIIEKNPKQKFFSSKNGFWYFYNKKDSLQTRNPQVGDHIVFTYSVKDLKGHTILTEKEVGIQNYIVDKNNQELISGIREGLKLMKEGETVTFLLPSYKAFGYYGIEKKLGTNVPVQCQVTLLKIKE